MQLCGRRGEFRYYLKSKRNIKGNNISISIPVSIPNNKEAKFQALFFRPAHSNLTQPSQSLAHVWSIRDRPTPHVGIYLKRPSPHVRIYFPLFTKRNPTLPLQHLRPVGSPRIAARLPSRAAAPLPTRATTALVSRRRAAAATPPSRRLPAHRCMASFPCRRTASYPRHHRSCLAAPSHASAARERASPSVCTQGRGRRSSRPRVGRGRRSSLPRAGPRPPPLLSARSLTSPLIRAQGPKSSKNGGPVRAAGSGPPAGAHGGRTVVWGFRMRAARGPGESRSDAARLGVLMDTKCRNGGLTMATSTMPEPASTQRDHGLAVRDRRVH
jgi:hypothetical protein